MLRGTLAAFAIGLAVLAAVLGVTHLALRPTEFRIAIPESDALDHKLFVAAREMLQNQRASVRIEVVKTTDAKAALDALEANTVKLAVLRSDAAMQGGAQTVLILRREAAVLIATKAGKLKKVTDLPNVAIGVTREGPLDGSLLWPVLDYYGIAREKMKPVAVPPDGVAEAIRQKKIEGVIVVGSLTSKQVSDIVNDVARGAKGGIEFIDIEESDAIAKRIPALESIEVEQGAFGGRPPRPSESFNTLAFSVRLVATRKADSDQIAELVRQLYLLRQNLNAAVPGAGLIETPDVDEATPFLIHPGARAYVNGEQKSLFDRYNDWIYFAAFALSGLGSVLAAVFHFFGGGRNDPKIPVEQVEAVFDAVRKAQTREELDAAEREAENVFHIVFSHGAAGKLPEGGMVSFGVAMTELRSRIAARRSVLVH